MPVNLDKPHLWKTDVSLSVDMYNDWFMRFAPDAFRSTRIQTTKSVEEALRLTRNLTDVTPATLTLYPAILSTLRMSTCPPLAVDRLIGLSGVNPRVVISMEKDKRVPPRLPAALLNPELDKIGAIIEQMADPDIFVWLGRQGIPPTEAEKHRAATIVADRLCGAVANPIIRNAQEKRQLAEIKAWLEARGYNQIPASDGTKFHDMEPGTFSFRMNVPVELDDGSAVNIPVDTVIQPRTANHGDFPILFEAKSAGDFTNTNKRRKEEAAKMTQLRKTYGPQVSFNLFLCGYFDSGYLGYEAAEGIDWVWEHRIDDLAGFGL